ALFDRGALGGSTAIGAALVLLVLLAGAVLATNRRLGLAAREATARLGPDMASSGSARPLSPAAQALWPALSRLDRDWREHAGQTETQPGAAAVISLHDITALKRADEMRADFIANAGHELKTPLSTLLGFIETLRGPARDDAAARERFLGIMQEQAGRMARLVDDLLSLSRIELNEHIVPTAHVALKPVLDSVAAALELRAAQRGIRIDLKLPETLPEAQGERDELAQVF